MFQFGDPLANDHALVELLEFGDHESLVCHSLHEMQQGLLGSLAKDGPDAACEEARRRVTNVLSLT